MESFPRPAPARRLVATYLRGGPVAEDGDLVGSRPRGRFLTRRPAQ
ncbi:hypothetical protein [Actinomadura madurae]|nr:hypothetical protein [Actinomadura madurae]MCP9980126.1 hypothetical protein [Actinomadura madurae]